VRCGGSSAQSILSRSSGIPPQDTALREISAAEMKQVAGGHCVIRNGIAVCMKL